MSFLTNQLEKKLAPGMTVPTPFKKLYSWMEKNYFYGMTPDWKTYLGYLAKPQKVWEGSRANGRPGGTWIEFTASGRDGLKYWFGHDRRSVLNRLCVFAKTGAEGSMAAFWLDDRGDQKIVHLGSGSGSSMVCVLADHAVDFLRLLAIGYDEICWGQSFALPPNANITDPSSLVRPNLPFRKWVKKTFTVSIPKTGSEIVRHIAFMGDKKSDDPFWQWVERKGK